MGNFDYFPKDWTILKLSEIGNFSKGKGITKSELVENGLPCVRYGEIYTVHHQTIKKFHSFISSATAKGSKKLTHNDLLFAGSGETLGEIGKAVAYRLHDEAYAGGDVIIMQIPKEFRADYIAYFLNSIGRNQLNKLGAGNSVVHIYGRDLGKVVVALPNKKEQNEVVRTLQTWDTAIEKTEALIAAKEKQFDWFRQNVLTGLIRIKNYYSPWEYQLFRDVLTEHKLVSTGKEDVHSVSVHKGVVNQIKHLGRSFSAKNTLHYNLVKPGDIIYTKSPTGEFPYGIIKQSKLQENVIVSPLYGVFSPRTYELGTILDAYFESSTYTSNYLRPVIQKGAKNTISCKNSSFLSRGLLLPTEVEEERYIAEHINTARREIDTLKALADQYRTQKRGLMQKLLTGKWRVKV